MNLTSLPVVATPLLFIGTSDAERSICRAQKVQLITQQIRRHSPGNSKSVNRREEVKNEGAEVYRNCGSAT
jgi:hypothetical protein